MQLIDSHAHLTFEPLAADLEGVIGRSIAAGVDGWITVGTDSVQNEKVVSIVGKCPNLFGTVGIHPHHAKETSEKDIERMRRLAEHEKIVAIGEAGLDFHYNFSKHDAQVELFRRQIKLAIEADLPLIVHSRNAFAETIEILDEFAGSLKKVVVHCFSGSADQAKLVVDKGYFVSFTGVVTFKNAQSARISAGAVPLERLMVETDCPYMSPAPMRKQKVNEPALMVHTARKLAEIKGVGFETFARQITRNTEVFFGL